MCLRTWTPSYCCNRRRTHKQSTKLFEIKENLANCVVRTVLIFISLPKMWWFDIFASANSDHRLQLNFPLENACARNDVNYFWKCGHQNMHVVIGHWIVCTVVFPTKWSTNKNIIFYLIWRSFSNSRAYTQSESPSVMPRETIILKKEKAFIVRVVTSTCFKCNLLPIVVLPAFRLNARIQRLGTRWMSHLVSGKLQAALLYARCILIRWNVLALLRWMHWQLHFHSFTSLTQRTVNEFSSNHKIAPGPYTHFRTEEWQLLRCLHQQC